MQLDETAMKRQMRVRPFWIAFPLIVLACLAVVLPGTLKRRAAAETSNMLRPLIAADARFSNVVVSTATSGISIVQGSVGSQTDMEALRKVIVRANTPQKPLLTVRVVTVASP
jgi:hypothetical protein